MTQQDAQILRVLDALRITPQHFLDFKLDIGHEAKSTVDMDFAIFVNSLDGTQAGHLGTIPQLIQNSIEFALFRL